MRVIYLLSFFLYLIMTSVSAQNNTNADIDEMSIDIPSLPPLNVLIDSAFSRSPQRLLLEKQKQEGKINLSMQKRSWLQNISFNGAYNYGKGAVLGTSQSTLNTTTAIFSDNSTSQYNAGISVGISLGAILDQKSKIRLTKIQNSKIDDEAQMLKDEMALKIFDEYSRLKLNLESLKGISMVLDSYYAQLLLAEKDYLNKRIKLNELTGAREAYSNSLLRFKQLKQDCLKSVFYLERATGMNFSNINNTLGK